MSELPELWLVRHGATAWSDQRRHTGRTDIPLTDAGRREAVALVRPLNAVQFVTAFVSPLRRARETARIAGFVDAEVVDDLREWDYGVYEGRTTAEIREEVPGFSVWNDPIPEGEAIEQVAARVDRVLERCDAVDGRVLLVAHAHLLRILTARALGLDATGGKVLALDPASISVIGSEYDYRALRRWNWTPSPNMRR